MDLVVLVLGEASAVRLGTLGEPWGAEREGSLESQPHAGVKILPSFLRRTEMRVKDSVKRNRPSGYLVLGGVKPQSEAWAFSEFRIHALMESPLAIPPKSERAWGIPLRITWLWSVRWLMGEYLSSSELMGSQRVCIRLDERLTALSD
jgi:hypothetical protein